jgi:hypothetical protein
VAGISRQASIISTEHDDQILQLKRRSLAMSIKLLSPSIIRDNFLDFDSFGIAAFRKTSCCMKVELSSFLFCRFRNSPPTILKNAPLRSLPAL